jgi:hypothetical protein
MLQKKLEKPSCKNRLLGKHLDGKHFEVFGMEFTGKLVVLLFS